MLEAMAPSASRARMVVASDTVYHASEDLLHSGGIRT